MSSSYSLAPNFKPIALKDTDFFKPVKVGRYEVKSRAVLAPLTRVRADPGNIPNENMIPYYDQRSKYPGTLIITEGTFPAEEAGGYSVAPGIWNETQVKAWSKIHAKIHENKSFVFQQLWVMGRIAPTDFLLATKHPLVSASVDYPDEKTKKEIVESGIEFKALTIPEIKKYVQFYVDGAKNAIKAGADGVEIHSANGYLLNQFIDPASNHRTDEYGGSIENRCRFTLEVIDAVIEAIGADRVGARFGPFGVFGGMSGVKEPTIVAHYAYIFGELERRAREGKRLAYIHLIQPRVTDFTFDEFEKVETVSADFVHAIWNGPIIKAGNYALDPAAALEEVNKGDVLIAYGRYFIANPDLPERIALGKPLTKYNRDTFYIPDPVVGYTDYPTWREQKL